MPLERATWKGAGSPVSAAPAAGARATAQTASDARWGRTLRGTLQEARRPRAPSDSTARLGAPEHLPPGRYAAKHQDLLSHFFPLSLFGGERIPDGEAVCDHGGVAEDVDRVLQLLESLGAGVVDVILIAAGDGIASLGATLQSRCDDDSVVGEEVGHLVHRASHPGPVAAADQLPDLLLLVGHHSSSGSAARGSPTWARCEAAVNASQRASRN